MISLHNVVKSYCAGENTVHALKGLNLTLPDKGLVSILGASGCGKTTLLNIIGGLDRPTSGELVVNGVSTISKSAGRPPISRPKVTRTIAPFSSPMPISPIFV